MPDLSAIQWILAAAVGLFLGFSKTGVAGAGILVVPLMATIFPVKASVGILLPMLIVGDFMAVAYYRRHAVWRHLVGLLPWVLVGMPLGYLALKYSNNQQMKTALGFLVLGLVALQIVKGRCGHWMENKLPHTWWFVALAGLLSGFATTLANAAGPIMSVYLLAKGLPKKEFIGTGAWYYMIVNLLKFPLYVSLGIITTDSLAFNAWMAPAILLGAVLGILVLPRIPQKLFEWIVILMTAIASLRLILS